MKYIKYCLYCRSQLTYSSLREVTISDQSDKITVETGMLNNVYSTRNR